MDLDLYFTIVYFLIFIVVIALPLTLISKYIWKNKNATQFFAFLGSISFIIVIIMLWDYLPD
jgi:hypothetical protein